MMSQSQSRYDAVPMDPAANQAGFLLTMSARLKAFRVRKGLSRHDLAQCAGLSLVRLGLFEAGIRIPTVEELFGLAACLDVEIPDLVD